MIRQFIALALIATLASFVACSQSDSGGGGVAAVPQVPVGVGPTGTGVLPTTCQVGQIHHTQYGCLNRMSCQAGHGWLPGQFICVPGTLITEDMVYGTNYGNRFYGTMSVSNAQVFSNLMKFSGQCDPYWATSGFYWGIGSMNPNNWSCNQWTNRGFLELRFFTATANGTAAQMYIGAGSPPSSFAGSWYNYIQPGQSSVGFTQSGRVDPINNNTGMIVVGVDYAGRDVGLRATINSGSQTSNSLQIQLSYQGQNFATVNATRY